LKVALPGAIYCTERLVGADIAVGVVTSAPAWYAEQDLDRLKFPVRSFQFVHGEENAPFHKPDPRVFDAGLAELDGVGIAPSEVTYVGDMLVDMQAADTAGLSFIAVTTGVMTESEFRAAGATRVISNLDEVPALIGI
jgi:phosphoglycolate phosphatase-like HAD superfamily hydrolase